MRNLPQIFSDESAKSDVDDFRSVDLPVFPAAECFQNLLKCGLSKYFLSLSLSLSLSEFPVIHALPPHFDLLSTFLSPVGN